MEQHTSSSPSIDLLVCQYLIQKGFVDSYVCSCLVTQLHIEDQWKLVAWSNFEETKSAPSGSVFEQSITAYILREIDVTASEQLFIENASVILAAAETQRGITILIMELARKFSRTVVHQMILAYTKLLSTSHQYDRVAWILSTCDDPLMVTYTEIFDDVCFRLPARPDLVVILLRTYQTQIDCQAVYEKAFDIGRYDICEQILQNCTLVQVAERVPPKDTDWIEYLRHLCQSSEAACRKCEKDHKRLWLHTKLSGTPNTRNKLRRRRNMFSLENQKKTEDEAPINHLDPFTQECISDIPDFMQFCARDDGANGYTYSFELPSFYHYTQTCESGRYTNPITRLPFAAGTREKCIVAFESLRNTVLAFYDGKCQCIL